MPDGRKLSAALAFLSHIISLAHASARADTKLVQRSPAVRASAVRDTLAFLDVFEPGAQRRVLERVPEASRQVIESTPRSSWISVEHDHWTIDAMVQIFGRVRAIACWRASLAHLVQRPLLHSFVSGMLAVIGRDPRRVIGLFVKGWPLVYRDVCEPRLIVPDTGPPAIYFDNISAEIRQYSNYLSCWEGVCQGFAYLAQVRGYVTFRVGPGLAWAQAEFAWD